MPAVTERIVHHADALQWLRANAPLDGASIVTSLPDISELGGTPLPQWQAWFEEAATLCMQAVPELGVAVFFQSDIRREGLWIDKGAMITRAAAKAEVGMLFHKIVCRRPAGSVTLGRASYSHMLGFSRRLRPSPLPGRTTADVLPDAGFMPGKKSMGVNACLDACLFIQRETTSHTVVDPFCGMGTVLAVAEHLGLSSIGVDTSSRMCRRARTLQIEPTLLPEVLLRTPQS